MGGCVIGGDVEGGHSVEVAESAIRDQSCRAAHLGAEGEDVAEGAAAVLAARFDHEHIARVQRVECSLLSVVSAAVGFEQVLPGGDEAKRACPPDQAGAGAGGPETVDRDVVEAPLAQLGAECGCAHRRDPGAQLGREHEAGRGLRLGLCLRQTRRLARSPGFFTLLVVGHR